MPNFFDQFDQPQARVTPPPSAPNFFDQFDEPELPAQQPVNTPERAALQAELDKRTAAADAAGKKLERTEAIAGAARPFLRGAVDLADGATALPRLLASLPIGALNLAAGTDYRLPISYSTADIADDLRSAGRLGKPDSKPGARERLAPQNDSEQLASTVTQGLGGVLGGLGIGSALGAGAGAASTTANVGRALAANPGLQTAGAVTGGVASDLARRDGAGVAGQTVAGVIGSLLPSTAVQVPARVADKVARGLTRTPEAQRLLDADVDLTPGQMNPKGVVNQLEEALQSAPVVGSTVSKARENALNTYQRAATERGAAPGTSVAQSDPATMLDDAYQSFQPLYDQAKGFPVRPVIMNQNAPDVPLDQAMQRVVAGRGIRATDSDRAAVQGVIDDQLSKGVASSDDLLDIRSAIRAEAREAAAEGNGAQAKLLRAADDQITKALESQLPAQPLSALKTADAKYGEYKTLEKAVARAKSKPSGFTANDLAEAVAQGNRGTGLGNYARGGGGPLRELADDGRKVFEVRSPPTGARMGVLGTLGAGVTALEPTTASIAGGTLLGAIGTQTGRRIAQGKTAPQQALRSVTQSAPVQALIADPYREQLALAIQQAIELRRRQEAQAAGAR
jgi:hypothetical protein